MVSIVGYVDGEPMPWWARTFPPCYDLYRPLFYFTIRPRNRRKRTLWCHGSHRVSIPHPESIFSFLAILRAVGDLKRPIGSFIGTIIPSSHAHVTRGLPRYAGKWQSLPLPIQVHWPTSPCSLLSKHHSHSQTHHYTFTCIYIIVELFTHSRVLQWREETPPSPPCQERILTPCLILVIKQEYRFIMTINTYIHGI